MHEFSFFFLSRIIFGIFFILNLILWSSLSSAAIPFGTLVALLALWFGISVPLIFVGSYFGFRKPVSCRSPNTLVLYIFIWMCNYIILLHVLWIGALLLRHASCILLEKSVELCFIFLSFPVCRGVEHAWWCCL